MKREIVILSRSLPFHGLGGMEIVAWDLAKQFARSGHAVRIITTSLPDKEDEFEQDGVCVVPLRGTPSGRYSSAWWSASRGYFEQHCMDSTQAILSVSAAAFGILPLKQRLPHIPFVMQAHGTSWGEVISKWRSHRFKSILSSILNLLWLPRDLLNYPKFDAVVAVGERVHQDLTKPPVNWMLPQEKVHPINNGIDTSIFRPSQEGRRDLRAALGLDEQTPVLISASRLHVQKGVSHALRAFALLHVKMPDAIYLIAGDGPEKPKLEALCAELGLTGHVRFLGALDRAQLAHALQAADAFVFLTERVEVGLTLNVLEALACGVPCIISDHLHLFESDLIATEAPHNADTIAKKINEALVSRRTSTQTGLPAQYELGHSSVKYLDLFRLGKTPNHH